jgi:pimeloyl-ACP methyl ester carboxylesterase
MGNRLSIACMGTAADQEEEEKKLGTGIWDEVSSGRINYGMRRRGAPEDELIIEQQALAMALHHQQKAQMRKLQRSLSQQEFRSNSNPSPLIPSTRIQDRILESIDEGKLSCADNGSNFEFKRSSSARPRRGNDAVLKPQELLHGTNGTKKGAVHLMAVGVDSLETKDIVLVHGAGMGAWCWYKSLALLQDSGLEPVAIDLAGSGRHSADPNEVATLEQYAEPLLALLKLKAASNSKVILVGHDIGGVCISLAMEKFPNQIAKAVFVTAAMLTDGQRAFDLLAVQQEKNADNFMPEPNSCTYGNGMPSPPTAFKLDKSTLRSLFFNATTSKDIALAEVSMRPVPFGPLMEKLVLTAENYGSVRRFFVETTHDQALLPTAQKSIIKQNPPEKVFTLKGSDHCPFFSKTLSLHKVFLEVAQLNSNRLT